MRAACTQAMRYMRCLPALFLVLTLLMPFFTINTSNLDGNSMLSEANRQPTLSIHESSGVTFYDNFVISGTIWDDDLPMDLRWELINNGTNVLSSNSINSMTENLSWSDGYTKSWEFIITVNASHVNSCSCLLIVEVVDIEYQVSSEKILLFINKDNSSLPSNIMHSST